jgi:hypothetical protein
MPVMSPVRKLWWRLARTPEERWFWGLTVLVVLVGAWLRSVRFWIDPIGLWGDEACWAIKLFRRSPVWGFRPAGFMFITKLLVGYGINDERTLRLLPYLASLGTLVVLPYVGTQLCRSRWPVLWMLGVVALHPLLIDFAKEFKPYSVEVFVHVSMIALVLRHRQTRSLLSLVGVLVSAPLGFFAAYNLVFLFPSVFLLVGVWALHAHQMRRLLAVTCTAAACIAVVLIASLTFFGSHGLDQGPRDRHWGSKYDMFYLESRADKSWAHRRHLTWTLAKHADQASMPGWGRQRWGAPDGLQLSDEARKPLQSIDYYFWVALYAGGLLVLARLRRFAELILLWLPLLVQVFFNVIGRWPLGNVRMNVFGLAYLVPIVMVALDAILVCRCRWLSALGSAACAAWVATTMLGLGLPNPYIKRKPAFHTEMVRILDRIHKVTEAETKGRRPRRKERLFYDAYSFCPVKYYLNWHTSSQLKYGTYFKDRFAPAGLRGVRKLRRGRRAWIVLSDPRSHARTRKWVRRKAKTLWHEVMPPTQQLYHIKRK